MGRALKKRVVLRVSPARAPGRAPAGGRALVVEEKRFMMTFSIRPWPANTWHVFQRVVSRMDAAGGK